MIYDVYQVKIVFLTLFLVSLPSQSREIDEKMRSLLENSLPLKEYIKIDLKNPGPKKGKLLNSFIRKGWLIKDARLGYRVVSGKRPTIQILRDYPQYRARMLKVLSCRYSVRTVKKSNKNGNEVFVRLNPVEKKLQGDSCGTKFFNVKYKVNDGEYEVIEIKTATVQ